MKELKLDRAENRSYLGNYNQSPHLSDGGDFIISDKHDIRIPASIVVAWRGRFPHIADIEAQMQLLASYILKGGVMHPGWNCPEGWMAGCLGKDNQKALTDARGPKRTLVKPSRY